MAIVADGRPNNRNGLTPHLVVKDLGEAIVNAVKLRTRPVVMTALMAAIGLLPAAVSTGIGSESQKPLAIVIIGGLVTATIFTLLVFPIVYHKALHIHETKRANS